MKKTFIKRIAVFAAAAVLIQSLALLLLTPSGLEFIFPLFSRFISERVNPNNNTYAVYYDMRVEVSEADLIVVGVDFNVSESYDILGHFTRFVKQYNNVSTVLLDMTQLQETYSSAMFENSDESTYNAVSSGLSENAGMTKAYAGYISELFFINRMMTPVRKFGVMSYSEGESLSGTELADKVALAFSKCERSAVCVVDSRELLPLSEFRGQLSANLAGDEIMYINTFYSENCVSPDTHAGFSFPLGRDGAVYFISNGCFESFYKFYSMTAEKSGIDRSARLDERFTDWFFVVSGGTLAE